MMVFEVDGVCEVVGICGVGWGGVGGERRELGLGVEMGVGMGGVDCALKGEGRGERGEEVGGGEWR